MRMDEKAKSFFRSSMKGGAYLVLGDASSNQDDLVRVLVEDAVLSGSNVLLFDMFKGIECRPNC